MTTVDMSRDGLRSGRIKFCKCRQAYETMCRIGDRQSYLIRGKGQTDTVYKSLEYLKEWSPAEYDYYETILKED